ncbi:MAG TPA: hypothetical protein PLS53_10930 [Thermoanaerobaculaceae bacterium]|nr:hypothetical protein [Thermoanaerobaculaceae bacterium]
MRDIFSNGAGQFWTPGGFEITVSAEHLTNRRDQLLSAYRQACLAQHGLHVTDRNQIIAAPVLHDGSAMTPELRQAIADARARAGKAYSAAAHRAGTLDYIRDNELDGIVPELNWERVWKYVESTLGPPRIVKPKELPTPPGELQLRLNQEFQDLILADPAKAELSSKEFLETWIAANTRRMSWWKPTTVDPSWFESYGHQKFPLANPMRTLAVTATVNFKKLADTGQTFRSWFQRRVVAALGDRIDAEFHREVQDLTRLASPRCVDDLLRAPGDPKFRIWMMDPGVMTKLGAKINENIIPAKHGTALIWDRDTYPFMTNFVMAREVETFEAAAMHIEPEDPFTVEIQPARLDCGDRAVRPGCFDVTARYLGSIHIPAEAAQFCWLAYLS